MNLRRNCNPEVCLKKVGPSPGSPHSQSKRHGPIVPRSPTVFSGATQHASRFAGPTGCAYYFRGFLQVAAAGYTVFL